MKYAKFKLNKEPCLKYLVKNDEPIMDYNEVSGKYELMIELEILGMVPVALLEEATHPDNRSAIDLAVYLTTQIKEKQLNKN